MAGPVVLLIALVTLLVGLATGKAWERYKLREGRWVDRRRSRDSRHYILGLNFLGSNQIDQAVDELSKAAELDPDAREIQMILGNLYREKGQVGRAIQVHQQLLQHSNLTKVEHVYGLLCLGLDYKRGGFVDRALAAFNEVLRLDPENEYALLNLEKLQEEQHQWADAYAVRQKLAALGGREGAARNRAILAFLENELGLQALKRGDQPDATRRFEQAIDLDPAAVPAYLNLGDVKCRAGDSEGAIAMWEKVIQVAPERAYLTFERLQTACRRLDAAERFADLCRGLIAANPKDWRARLALSDHLAERGTPAEGLPLLFDALVQNPHALAVHQAIWKTLAQLDLRPDLVDRYVDIARSAVFYLDPHVCMRCRYRSTELLWQCPQCHEWNTFVEERIAPRTDQ
jgi:lipopolysaccharide biosynthesis regulator YciM